jgi:hypothetical protein
VAYHDSSPLKFPPKKEETTQLLVADNVGNFWLHMLEDVGIIDHGTSVVSADMKCV